MRGPAVTFSEVSLELGGTQILQRVSFSVTPGEIHCVIGPNGGGKTSLIRSVLGEMPHSGEITFAWGENTTIGYVPQSLEFDRTLPVSVNDFMAMISQRRPAFLGLGRSHRDAVTHALDRVGLAGKQNRTLGDLSGGERQRVLIAQALIPQPALLVLDEPMTAMDEAGARIVECILTDVAQEGTTVLWIAHDVAQVRRMAHTVTCLNRNVRFHGRPAEVMTNDNIAEIFGVRFANAGAAEAAQSAP
jgi:zinc transport system ATP-binding protein